MVAARALQSNKKKGTLRQQVNALLHDMTGKKAVIMYDFALLDLLEGDHKAAIFFNQVLYWSDVTEDPDGWFYKTYAEWEAELHISRYQINRMLHGDKRTPKSRRTLTDIGVETMVKKGRYTGNPTVHYRVNREKLLQGMADYIQAMYNIPAEEALARTDSYLMRPDDKPMRNIVTDRTPQTNHFDPQQSISPDLQQINTSSDPKISTEKESSENESKIISHPPPDDDSDIQIFSPYVKRFGKLKKQLPALLRAELERLGSERVGEVLERCSTRGRSWNYVLRALANETVVTSEKPVQYWAAFNASNEKTLFEVVKEPKIPVSSRVNTFWEMFSGKALTMRDAWSSAQHQMEMQFGSGRFLVNDATLVDFDAETATFTVVVRNLNAQNELQQRYYRTVRRIMSDIFGQAAEVRFVAKNEWSLPENVAQDGG
jgi:hypothetical protein